MDSESRHQVELNDPLRSKWALAHNSIKKDIVKSVTYAARGHILGELLRHKPGQGRSRSRQKSAGALMSSALREGVQRLEITTRVTLGVLALASGVYTYLGVRDLLNGNATVVFFAAVIYAVAVSIGIYAFWTFLMRFMPHVRERQEPRAAVRLHGARLGDDHRDVGLAECLGARRRRRDPAASRDLGAGLYPRPRPRASQRARGAEPLPDIQMAATRFAKLAEAERGGSLTGTSGSGTVVQLLTQMSTQLGNLAQEVTQSGERAKTLYEQGGKHLEKMRELVSDRGPINAAQRCLRRGSHGADGHDHLAAADLGRAGGEARRRRPRRPASSRRPPAAAAISASGRPAWSARSKARSPRRRRRCRPPPTRSSPCRAVEPERFQPLSPAEAVLRYAGDFLPSWAGAISIDLMPAVLVLILCVVHAGIRREGQPEAGAATMSAADIITALRLAREVENANAQPCAAQPAGPAVAAAALDENVTALPPRARGKKDWRRAAAPSLARRAAALAERPAGRHILRWLFGVMVAGDGRACSRSIISRCCRRRSGRLRPPRPADPSTGEAIGRAAAGTPRRRAAAPRRCGRRDSAGGDDDIRACGRRPPDRDRHHHARHGRGLRRRDRQARRLCQDRGAAFARRLGAGRAEDGPADPRAEIRDRGRGRRAIAPRPVRWFSPAASSGAPAPKAAIGVHQIFAAVECSGAASATA